MATKDYNEFSLKLSKATEKILLNEKRNKRKSKLFKTDENSDNNVHLTVSNLKFREEDYIISNECKYTLEQFEKLSVGDNENMNSILATIRKELDEPSPKEEFVKLSKPRKIIFTEMMSLEPIEMIISKKAKLNN
jgi:hypothetical protein